MSRLATLTNRWRRREGGAKRQLGRYRQTEKRGYLRKYREHRGAMRFLRRLIRQEKAKRPRIVTGIVSPSAIFGSLGTPQWITGHYTAGPIDRDLEHAIALCKAYDSGHRANGWGGIGYHVCIARSGEIIPLRPIRDKGAHVGGYNTGNVGVMFHGTLGDLPSVAQRESYRWYLANAHTDALPPAHRSPVDLSRLPRRGHNDWPTHTTNSCPGQFKPLIVNA